MDSGVSGEERLGFHSLSTNVTCVRSVSKVLLAVQPVGVDEDLVAFQLILAAEFAPADVTEVWSLAGVHLEVDGELRFTLELFPTEVTEQRAGSWSFSAAVHVNNLLVVLEVVGPHVGFGAEVTAVRFDPRVDDLVCFQPRPAVKRFTADGAEPRLHYALLLQLGDAVGMESAQVMLQVVTAIEAQVTQVAGVRFVPRVDEGMTS